MKLYTIAYSIPPNMMSLQVIIATIKAQLYRFTPIVFDRMTLHYQHEEGNPTNWLESLVNLPNRGYDLVTRQIPKPLDISDIPRLQNEPPPENRLNLDAFRAAQSIHAIRSSSLDICRNCGKAGHWARECKADPRKIQYRNRTEKPHDSSTYLVKDKPIQDGQIGPENAEDSEDDFIDECTYFVESDNLLEPVMLIDVNQAGPPTSRAPMVNISQVKLLDVEEGRR